MLKTPSIKPPSGAPVMAPTLDEAELCLTLADFHGLAGRSVLGIVLRKHLEPLFLTPTELIHGSRALNALLEQRSLVEGLVVKVATIQARQPGQDPAGRRAAIERALAETVAKASDAQLALARLPGGRSPLEALLALAHGRSPTGDPGFEVRAALGMELGGVKGWGSKLDRLLQLVQRERHEALAAAIDDVIGDILALPAASQDLLGGGAPQAVALQRLCELALGRMAVDRFGPDRIGVLNGLFRQGKLPSARAAVLDRLQRHLRSPHPLAPGQPQLEGRTLQALLASVLTPAGLLGGTAMAEALTIRFSRRLEQGGSDALRRSIGVLCQTQTDLVCHLHYLAALVGAPLAGRLQAAIVEAFDQALANERLVETMLLQSPDTALVQERLTAAVEAIEASSLPVETRARIAGRAKHIVGEYARRGRLIERLQQIEPLPRRRAIRLAELACSGLVREGGALPLLRQHIMDIVRQPAFQEEMAAKQGDTIVQAELKRLFDLLERLRQGTPAISAPTTVADRSTARAPSMPSPAMSRPAPMSKPAGGPARCPGCFAVLAGGGICGACGYPEQSDNREGIHLTPGTALIGRFRSGRILGQGGFGATYLGWDERLQVKVAIKEFYPSSLIARAPGAPNVVPFSDEHARGFAAGLAKFIEEARLLARLRDIKGIVAVQDFFEENGTAYLVMELLEGRTMKRCMADGGGRLDLRRTMTILSPVIGALQSLHDQGLIHRDVSPDNIFETLSGERKLLDFGAARCTAGRIEQAPSFTVILKPGYAPPEQYAQDGAQGPWTDVYALCATIYCALTGRPPPDATTRFLNDKVPGLAELGVAVPPAFERALMAGLSMRHQERPPSMRHLLMALSGR